MYPPIQALQETITRKDLPLVCEYQLETESPESRVEGPSGGTGFPSMSDLLTGIELGKVLCEANEA